MPVKGIKPAFELRDRVVVEGFGEATIVKVRPLAKPVPRYDVKYSDGSTYTKIHESELTRKFTSDWKTLKGITLNLIIYFSNSEETTTYRAVRQISCKSSEYLIDIVKRIKSIYIKNRNVSIEDFSMKKITFSTCTSDRHQKNLPLIDITIGELGIEDQEHIFLIRRKNQGLDWIPQPITGGEVWTYCVFRQKVRKKCFYSIVKKLGIHNPPQVDKVWALIRNPNTGYCLQDKFDQIFTEKENFVDNFYQALLGLGIVLSDSYARFFTDIERLVWLDLNISPSEKERVIKSEAYGAIKDAVLKNGDFNNRVVGVIFSYYGGSVIPLPYCANARERFFLRKVGIEKIQFHLKKLIVNEIVEKAKNEIYERLLRASLVEFTADLVHTMELSIEWILHPDHIREAISKHFIVPNVRNPMVDYREWYRPIGYGTIIKSVMEHFKDGGFTIKEKFERIPDRDDYYDRRNSSARRRPRRRSIESDRKYVFVVIGFDIIWKS